jgi:hypothetical protein
MLDQVERTEEDGPASEFSQRSLELLEHIHELEERLRQMHPSIVASRVVSSDVGEDPNNDEHEDASEEERSQEDASWRIETGPE